MITLKNVTKKYEKTAVDNLSLQIKKGELFGLLGPNGAGKTTTIRMIMALTKMTSGSIIINGVEVNKKNVDYKKHIGFVPQKNNLESELTVEQNLILHGKLFKMSKSDIKKRIIELLKFAGLTDKSKVLTSKLSGGMKRKLVVIRALMHDPSILLLDEPTTGLDVMAKRKLWDLIKKLHKTGKTIILTTHYLDEAEALCGEIVLLKDGKIRLKGDFEYFKSYTGSYTVEAFKDDKTELKFFDNQQDAYAYAAQSQDVKVRETKLEDIFVKLTDGYAEEDKL